MSSSWLFGTRRRIAAAVVLLAADQVTKTAAQIVLDGQRYELADGWGVTYVVNPGTWLAPDVSGPALAAIQLSVALVWVAWMAGMSWYARHFRPSVALDWAAGFLTLAAFGNLVDRLLVGGARDWAITPVATGNLADIAVWPAIILLGWELWCHPPARRLLSWDPRRWRP